MSTPHKLQGLSPAEVAQSRERFGTNVLTKPERAPLWKLLLEKFRDPLIVILLAAGVLSIGIALYEHFALRAAATVFFEPVGIFVAIFLATGLAFHFEHKAEGEFDVLNQVNDEELVEVIRSGGRTLIPKCDVVVGDIVVMGTGAEVPADGVLLEASALTLDESSLTGEPLCRKTTDAASFDADATFPSNALMRGTKVMEGHGIMKVTAVGDATEHGRVFEAVQIDDGEKTPLDEQLDRLADVISALSYAVAALVIVGRLFVFFQFAWQVWLLLLPTGIFFAYVVRQTSTTARAKKAAKKSSALRWTAAILAFLAAFLAGVLLLHHVLTPDAALVALLSFTLRALMIAVTLIVVAVPEGLPMAVTLSLAYSMRRMLRTGNLVRKMHACETMGATTVICTDKTGTLTENRMTVAEMRLSDGTPSDVFCEGIAVNSTAALDVSRPTPTVVGNPTEGALLLYLRARGVDFEKLRADAEVLSELPFSTERKFMATVVKSGLDGKRRLYVKGAPEIVHALCTSTAADAEIEQSKISDTLAAYQKAAMRTLAFAAAELSADTDATAVFADGKISAPGLTFLGIAAIADPLRADVPEAIRHVRGAGIDVKVVTGDTPLTACEIARQAGLLLPADADTCVITGPQLAALSDAELLERCQSLKVIARARPMDKKRLVEALQEVGEVVAVTGDGTNDAPALRAAHVGLSMGDGTAVAKEASDITILEGAFSSIGVAVMWGRSLYQNIQRFLLFQLTVNVSACLLVLSGAFMGLESPLTVTQMLWVNLIMDTFGAMALASLPPSASVMHDAPRARRAFILTKNMVMNIIGVGAAFFLLLLGVLYVFHHADVRSMAFFLSPKLGAWSPISLYEQTLLFSIFVWTHFWYMFCARAFATGQSIFRLRMSGGFWTIVSVIVVGQVAITELGADFFNVAPMLRAASTAADFLVIALGTALIVGIREVWSASKRAFGRQ